MTERKLTTLWHKVLAIYLAYSSLCSRQPLLPPSESKKWTKVVISWWTCDCPPEAEAPGLC